MTSNKISPISSAKVFNSYSIQATDSNCQVKVYEITSHYFFVHMAYFFGTIFLFIWIGTYGNLGCTSDEEVITSDCDKATYLLSSSNFQ